MLTDEVRKIKERAEHPGRYWFSQVDTLCESWLEQSATIVLLREALEPLANMLDSYETDAPDDVRITIVVKPTRITIGDCRKARAALSALPEQAGVSDRDAEQPWPMRDCAKVLADYAEHHLKAHNCDCHGYELVMQAIASVRAALGAAEGANDGPV